MQSQKRITLICLGLILSVLCSGCSLWTVVKNDAGSQAGGTQFYFDDSSFDADKFVASVWKDKVVPFTAEKAVEANDVLLLMKSGLDKAGEKYGIRSSAVGTAWNFIIKGKAKVLQVNTTSRNGLAELDLEPFDGKADLMLQIGPVFKGTSVRDTLSFIKFDDYKNQMVFASISTAMNTYIRTNVTSTLDVASLKGKELQFVGTFTGESADQVVMTPVSITESAGGK